MAFCKDKIIYENKTTKIYINQCHNKGRKTKLFSIRKDDSTGLAELLGIIKWNGRWRQYVFEPKKDTMWSHGCLAEVSYFLIGLNIKKAMEIKKVKGRGKDDK